MVLNYNGARFITECLSSVLSQQFAGAFEVVVVDNDSQDGSAGLVRNQFPNVRLIELRPNLGYAAGNNIGIKNSSARYVVLLNNDTRVRPGWLQALVATAEAHPKAGAVTSKLVFMNEPGLLQNTGTLLLSDGSGADRGFRETDTGQYETQEEVFGACPAAALYRREMLADVGAFDETFFMYYEDTDLSWRMRLKGWTVLYEPSAVVEHVHAGSSGEWSPLFIFHVDRNRLFMILKNAPWGMVASAFARLLYVSLRNAAALALRRRRSAGPAGGTTGNAAQSRARLHARVLSSFLQHAPEMLMKRRKIRHSRRVDDSAILSWLYPRELWAARSK